MVFPQQILDDYQLGKQYYSNLNTEYVANLKKGCDNCFPKDFVCLMVILRDLGYKIELDEYDDVAIALYKKMMFIIGESSYEPSYIKFYFGWSDFSTTPTLEEIELADYIEGLTGDNPTIIFPNAGAKNYWMAELSSEPLKTKWQDTVVPINNGNIGSVDDLFGVPVIVSPYRVYDTSYATSFSNPIQFKTT